MPARVAAPPHAQVGPPGGHLGVEKRAEPAAAGVAYYDLISLGRATWHNREDTSGRGFARGCRPNDGRQGNGD